jgi:hypothetical protein
MRVHAAVPRAVLQRGNHHTTMNILYTAEATVTGGREGKAERVCPYANAVRGNIPVQIAVE